jgi:hypothetical protein
VATLIVLNHAMNGDGFAMALPVGANALAFFILDKYCRSFFGKITNNH